MGYGAPAAVGAALANRKYGRLSINIQQDGDLNYAPGVLPHARLGLSIGGSGWLAGTARPLMMRTMRSLLIAMFTAWRTFRLSKGAILTFMVT